MNIEIAFTTLIALLMAVSLTLMLWATTQINNAREADSHPLERHLIFRRLGLFGATLALVIALICMVWNFLAS